MNSAPQTFFLTGCASGIGRHVATQLLARGHRVFATDVNAEALQAFARAMNLPETQLRIAALDVRDAADWERVFAEAVQAFGKIEITMNIAGVMIGGEAMEASPELVHRHVDINFKGVIFGTQTAARHLSDHGGGQIINIASMSALAPIRGLAIYGATKFAVRGFSLAIAQELRDKGIYVTTINPDAVNTPLLDPNRDIKAAAMIFSSDRLLSVDDIARAILDEALPKKPLEINIPRHRGWLAMLTGVFPRLTFWIAPHYVRRGLEHQAQLVRRSN